MKKIYKLTDLCCASCAAEMERDIAKVKGITLCSVNFLTQKLTLETEDPADLDAVLKKVGKIVRRIEPDCEMIEVL